MIPLHCPASPLREPLSQRLRRAGCPTDSNLLRRCRRRWGRSCILPRESVSQLRLPGKWRSSARPVKGDWPGPVAQYFHVLRRVWLKITELRKLRNSPCHPGFADNYLSSNGNRNCPLAGPAACPGCEQVESPGWSFGWPDCRLWAGQRTERVARPSGVQVAISLGSPVRIKSAETARGWRYNRVLVSTGYRGNAPVQDNRGVAMISRGY